MELDRLRDPQRIAQAAVHLGMVQSFNPAFLELGTGKVVGQPGGTCTPLRINELAPKRPPELNPPAHVVTVPPETTGDTGRQNHANRGHRGQNHQ